MDNQEFITLAGPAAAELIEKKSRFIGYASPVADEAAAMDFLQEIRSRHRDATHNCYAYQATRPEKHGGGGDALFWRYSAGYGRFGARLFCRS